MQMKIQFGKFKEVMKQVKNKEPFKELQSLMKNADVKRVTDFVEKEIKEIRKLQSEIPTELAKLRKTIDLQLKEFEKTLKSARTLKTMDQIFGKMGGRKKQSKTSDHSAPTASTASNPVVEPVVSKVKAARVAATIKQGKIPAAKAVKKTTKPEVIIASENLKKKVLRTGNKPRVR